MHLRCGNPGCSTRAVCSLCQRSWECGGGLHRVVLKKMVGVGAGLLVLILMKAHYHNFVLYHINKSQYHLFDHQSPPTIPQPQILQHRCAAQDAKDKKATKSLVHREKFKDFSQNAYTLVISRCQQLALSKAGNKLPPLLSNLNLLTSGGKRRRQELLVRTFDENLE